MRAAGVRLAMVAFTTTVLVAASGVSPAAASDGSNGSTCHRGSIAAGTYGSLHVVGTCNLDAGDVKVTGDLTVEKGGALVAAYGGSNLQVRGDLELRRDSSLVLGCEPEAFKCLNDPDFNNETSPGTLVTNDSIGGSLSSDHATMVIAHHNQIGRNVEQVEGGGGLSCSNFPLGPSGPPAYTTYEDNTIGGNAIIDGVTTCWIGFIRNHVHRNVNFHENASFDPDGNEVVANTVGHNLNCSDNAPHAQIGDSMGAKNTVGHKATGECRALV